MTEQLARVISVMKKKGGRREKGKKKKEKPGKKRKEFKRTGFARPSPPQLIAEQKKEHPRPRDAPSLFAVESETCDQAIYTASLYIVYKSIGPRGPTTAGLGWRASTGGTNRYNTSMAPRAHI